MMRSMNRFRRDVRGATMVEFALVALPLMVLLLAPIDMGYRTYLKSETQGALQRAARMSSLGRYSNSEVDTALRAGIDEIAPNATVEIKRLSYRDFSGIGKPEKITGDTVPLGSYNVGDCYQDANNNSQYDLDSGKDSSGGADDVVVLQAKVTFDRIVPLTGLMGLSATESVTSSMVVQNQPYSDRDVYNPPVRCS